MHVVCLREVYIHPDETWYLNTLYVTCKVHKPKRPDESYMRQPCHHFYRGDIYLQETFLWSIYEWTCKNLKEDFPNTTRLWNPMKDKALNLQKKKKKKKKKMMIQDKITKYASQNLHRNISPDVHMICRSTLGKSSNRSSGKCKLLAKLS